MDINLAIKELNQRHDLKPDVMHDAMQAILEGECTDLQIADFLVGLQMKGESIDEITVAAHALLEKSLPVDYKHDHLVDIVGTGGDGANLFNVSTASALVAAAAGAKVAKHGNRSASSKSGFIDVIEQAGVDISLTSSQLAICLERVNIAILFAQNHHPAMKHVMPVRKALGIRTLFNYLGPLINPAHVKKQVIGVYPQDWQLPFAATLKELGSEHSLVVHSYDGLDEISIADKTHIAELHHGTIKEYDINPRDFGMPLSSLKGLQISTPEESLDIIHKVLNNQAGPAKDMVTLNAGAAIYAADIADTLAEGIALAQAHIADGSAAHVLKQLITTTQELAHESTA